MQLALIVEVQGGDNSLLPLREHKWMVTEYHREGTEFRAHSLCMLEASCFDLQPVESICRVPEICQGPLGDFGSNSLGFEKLFQGRA